MIYRFIAIILILNSCVVIGKEQAVFIPFNVGSKPNHQFRQNLSLKDVDYAISNKDFAKAASTLTQLKNLEQTTKQKYMTIIKEGFGDFFLETINNENIFAALPYYYSLQSLSVADNYISKSEFAEKLFHYYLRKEYFGAALDFAQTSLQSGIQLENNVRKKFQKLIQKQFENNPQTKLDFWEQRVKGTVTVIVKLGSERIPNTPLYLPSIATGSGFFIDNNGSIITNHHVISSQTDNHKSGSIFVKLSARDELIPARLVGWDPNRDLALLRISRTTPYLLPINSKFNLIQQVSDGQNISPTLFIGNELYAIGTPGGFTGGLENTLTSGRVSARGRELLPLTEVLQIDVPVNLGNSGGPLLNNQGIIEGIIFGKRDFEGIAFAIPSSTLSSVIPRLYQGEKVSNSWLGLLIDEYSNNKDYLEIRYIFPNSPAASSPLKPGMRIISYRNSSYTKIKPLQHQISNGPISAIVQLTVQDPNSNKTQKIFLELEKRPDKPMYKNLEQESTAQLFYALFGAQLTVEVDKRNYYTVTNILPYSQASFMGFSEGDHLKIIQWLIDSEENFVIAHISYTYSNSFNEGNKQSVLRQELDLPNIL